MPDDEVIQLVKPFDSLCVELPGGSTGYGGSSLRQKCLQPFSHRRRGASGTLLEFAGGNGLLHERGVTRLECIKGANEFCLARSVTD